MSSLIQDDFNEQANSYLKNIEGMSRIQLSLLRTFYQNLKPIGDLLGIDLWAKRDDLTAAGFGGNKTRKMDFLLAEALQAKATHLIAVGSVQSNFCRIAASYAAVAGIKCTLVLGGAQRRHTGNHLLGEMFGAECVYVEGDNWREWEDAAAKLEMKLLAHGEITYRMPMGGSTPVGSIGYVLGFLEIMNQAHGVGSVPSIIYTASSTGGTHAGLLVGQDISGWKGYIQGVAVAPRKHQLAKETLMLTALTCGMLKKKPDIDVLHLDDAHVGEGYGIPSEESKEAQLLFARRCGIVLDNVYTAKAAAAIVADAQSGKIPQGATVTLLHTGGSPEVWA
ncbi:MAG: hypothetical protein CL946_07190 [Ectothiorhodospiraceae bacterium]|nr:hypothetical protein [Ectothiorhodospiraceae bacterium]